MDQKTRDQIAAEIAADYRATLRQRATEEEPTLGRSSGYVSGGRSMRVAYLLWTLLGGFGIHRFYLGRARSGAVMATLTVCGSLLFLVPLDLAGYAAYAVVSLWWLADVFLIPGMMPDRPIR